MNKHPKRPGCAPCLSSPCPWSSVSRNDGEPKWPRLPHLASLPAHPVRVQLSPNKTVNLPMNRSAQQNRWGMTARRVRTAGWKNSSTRRARAGEGKVPWWQPAVCVPHGTASRGAALPHPDPPFFFLFHTAHSQFMHLFLFSKIKASIPTKQQPPRVAEYPAETTGILSAQDNNKNGAQLAVPPDVQY